MGELRHTEWVLITSLKLSDTKNESESPNILRITTHFHIDRLLKYWHESEKCYQSDRHRERNKKQEIITITS